MKVKYSHQHRAARLASARGVKEEALADRPKPIITTPD